MADAYSQATTTPVMAIAFIQSIRANRLDSDWMKHRVLNYINQLAYLDRVKHKKKNNKKRPLSSFTRGGFFLLDDLVDAIKNKEDRAEYFKEEARLKQQLKKESVDGEVD